LLFFSVLFPFLSLKPLLLMFLDLNIPVDNDDKFAHMQMAALANALVELGYDGCAYNVTLKNKVPKDHVCNIQPLALSATEATGRQLSGSSMLRLQADARGFRQLRRLTVLLEETTHLHTLNPSNPALKQYDVVAVQPSDERTFQQACTGLDVDVISIDFTQRLPYHLKLQHVQQAVERGVYFEICYSPMIKDASCRRNLISNSMSLLRACKRSNVFMSSAASRAFDMRGPYDVMNLGCLFGLHPSSARAVVGHNPAAVLACGFANRKTFRGAASMEFDAVAPPEIQPSQAQGQKRPPASAGSGKGKQSRADSDDFVGLADGSSSDDSD
jgi:ribonuclease P/MRP protein subunit RPP1